MLVRTRTIGSTCGAIALFALAAAGCTGEADGGPLAERASIIILDLDTLRADHLGAYGYVRDTSPHLDGIAQESVVFERAYSQAPNTPPSQSSILTGLYPSTHGMISDEDRLPDEVETLAENLAANGYETAAFVDGGYMQASFGVDQGFALYHDNRGRGLAGMEDRIDAWIEEHSASERPFLLLIHTYDIHTPYAPPEPFRSAFLEGLDEPTPGFEPTPATMEAIRKSVWTDDPQTLSEADLRWAEALYDGGIRYVDDWIGRFWARCVELGLDERSVLVVVSDHGEEFQEHGNVLHEKLYSTVTHVPLVVRLPRGERSQRVERIVELVDVAPTLLDLVGSTPLEAQGESLASLIETGRGSDGTAFSESPFFGHRRAVAADGHRLLWTRSSDEVELYDLRVDPLELAERSAEDPEQADRLLALLHRWQASIDAHPGFEAGPPRELDEEARRQLEALGYLE